MKLSQSTNNQLAFGWNTVTHEEMTKLALKDNKNLSEKEKHIVASYVQMPDFDSREAGFLKNTHFFFPHSTNSSFGKGGNKHNNAYSRFKELLHLCVLSKNREEFLKNLAYAAHYLQDVSTPLHTEPGGIIQKILKYKTHTNFERGKKNGATVNIEKLKKGYKPEIIDYSSILGLFIDTAIFSSKPQFKVNMFNKKEWPRIQQFCFNKGVNVSKIFFETLTRTVRL